ncbi:hypothetical protein PHYPSEUDO_002306 [Phytophthora pseudosyringae]|uniref:PHD-type domain-containing protein n=1 Tax=Phytophthora pseudosyringae TaxID=221518 RepID=A0A8T1WDA5_9STRA|nr:hypothetical protein PHYPSEUDO_002306 [Phytophthora pseudosyringae]
MLSVPLTLFRGGDASLGADIRVLAAPAKLASGAWLGQFLAGLGTHLAALGELKALAVEAAGSRTAGPSRQEDAVERSGDDSERPASSPCPSSSSSSSSGDSSSSSASSGSSSSDSSDSSSDGEDEAPPPPANGSNSGGGNGGDDQKKKKKEEEEEKEDEEGEDGGHSSDSSSSSSDSSAGESDQEEDDGVMIDTDDEKDKAHNGVDPTDDDLSGESDGSSDLENSYPRLPSAPVDTLIAFRQQAALKELQLTEKLKKGVIADAKQRHQERQQALRSKKKKRAPQSKRRHSKQSDVTSNESTHLERHHTNGSTGTADVKMAPQEQDVAEDEWMVDCSCGLKEKNYDDGTSMIQCDSCSQWVHAKCADKQPEAVAQEKFLCFRCGWMFDCVCDVRRRPNHDDGQRMVECESCKTWQHTMCVGIPMTEEPADDYRCPRCVKKVHRRKSASKGSGSRDRQRKRSHTEQSQQQRKSKDASPVVAVDVRSAARSIDTLTTPTRAHRSRRTEPKESPKMERKTPLVCVSSPPVPAVSPPSTPPPPPSTPPPPSVGPAHAVSRSSKRDRSRGQLKRRSERERERSSASSRSSNRKRGRSLGSSPSSSKKEHSHLEPTDREHQASPPTEVTPSPRGKGLMLRGYSPASARTDASSSRPVDVRPPLPLTPRSGGASSEHSYSSHNNHGNGGRKRKASSARDRLAKKLKIRKSSLR